MGRIVMGYWDCPFCGNKEIRGDEAKCPSCGRARGDVQFYLKGYKEGASLTEEERQALGAETVDDKTAAEIGKNPDWYCSFCNSLNSDNAQVCGTCGASREDSEANYFQMLEKNKAKEAAELAAQPHPSEPKKKRPLWFWIAIVAVIGLLVYALWPKTVKGQVTAVSWTRNIEVQAYQPFQESSWDAAPASAENVTTQIEARTYTRTEYVQQAVTKTKQVQVGTVTKYRYRDLGNGLQEEIPYEEPVYEWQEYTDYVTVPVSVPYTVPETKYYYTVWRWTPARTETASGEDQNPYWPEVTYGENEKEGTRTEIYRFTATDDKGSPTTYRILESTHAESDWKNLPVGTKVKIKGGRSPNCGKSSKRSRRSLTPHCRRSSPPTTKKQQF